MLRFVILRKTLDRGSGLQTEGLETVDAECPELERVLMGGGSGMDMYDYRELKGVEVLPVQRRAERIVRLRAEIEALLAEDGAEWPSDVAAAFGGLVQKPQSF